MICVTQVSKTYRQGFFSSKKICAVDTVSFSIEKGCTLGLLGNSGCGKSTVAKLLMGMEQPDKGEIFIQGKNIAEYSKTGRGELSRIIQMIFQQPEESFDPEMKIEKSLLEPMEIHKLYTKKQRKEKVRELMFQLNLSEILLEQYPHQISGGEAQRLSIVRALTLEPGILILDEATSMLDISTQAQILRILKELQKRKKLTYLFISHDPGTVQWMCDTVAVMKNGKIIEYGACEEVFHRPKDLFTRKLVNSWYSFDINL